MFAPWRSQNPVHKTWVSDYLETGTVQSIHVPSTSILLVSGGGGGGESRGRGRVGVGTSGIPAADQKDRSSGNENGLHSSGF